MSNQIEALCPTCQEPLHALTECRDWVVWCANGRCHNDRIGRDQVQEKAVQDLEEQTERMENE